MRFNLTSGPFLIIIFIHLGILNKCGQSYHHYRHGLSNRGYFIQRPGRFYRYRIPEHRNIYIPQPDLDDIDDEDIINLKATQDISSFSSPMLAISNLSQMSGTHGTGEIKDPIAEEEVKPIMTRAIKKKQKSDGAGLKLSEPHCGQSSQLMEERIVNGKEAPVGAYPWIVVVLKDGEAWCGGSILNKHWIITAAHCFADGSDADSSSWAIRVGSNDKNSGTTYKIQKVITHERFNLDNMMNSDLALMKTLKAIKFTKLITSVCIPDNSYQEPRQDQMLVAGWGAQQFDDGNMPVKLQDVNLNVIKDGDCAQKYKQKRYTIYKSQFCTWNYKQDSCQGDSGGPAIELYDGKAYLVGVVSYGVTCADDFPGVYTQISYFIHWISTTIKNN